MDAKHIKVEAGVAWLVGYARLSRGIYRKCWRLVRPLKHDRRGSAILEFALVSVAYLTLIFTMIDAMWMMTVEMVMNDATQEASRLGSLNALPDAGLTREQSIKKFMVTRAAGLLDASALTIVMQSYGGAYNYGHHPVSATQTAGAGGSRHLVQYIITYTQPILTPLAVAVMGGKTSVIHKTTIMVQNEPF
jgi:TadE-like protein